MERERRRESKKERETVREKRGVEKRGVKRGGERGRERERERESWSIIFSPLFHFSGVLVSKLARAPLFFSFSSSSSDKKEQSEIFESAKAYVHWKV